MKRKNLQLNEKRSEKILGIGKAAARLFNENGYLETSMDEISDASGLSKGGTYHYFSSKNDILYFILMNYMDLILKNLEEDLKGIEGSFGKLQFVISHHIELFTKNVPESKILLHEAYFLPTKYLRTVAEKERKYFRLIADVLSGLLGRRVSKGQLTVITFTLLGMCNWIYSWYNPEGPITPKELSDIISCIFFKGISAYQE
jgi:AcrR family transcriptional regulator